MSNCAGFTFFVDPPEGGAVLSMTGRGGHSIHTARERALKRGGAELRAAAAPTAPIESFLVVGPIGPDRELIKL